jgi:hypothetical protein
VNLEGSLGAFGLADVFALLASTGKSGRLVLRRDGADRLVEGEVWFRDGRLSGASADLSRAALLRRVVGTGQVEDVALRQAVARATAGGRGAARALLESAAIDAEVLRTAAAEQALDAVADLLAWDDGEFSFELGTPDPDDIGLGLDPAQTAAAASTRAAEFADLTALVPGPDTVLVVRVAPDEDPVLTRDEWSLLALVDGRREVRDLVELTGSSHYAVVSTLAGLVRRGLLSLAEAGDHVAEVERRLALLAPLESATSAPSLTTADEPAPAPAPTPAPPEAAEPAEPPRTTVPEPPGAHGLTAAAALAAARAAQARPDTAARPAARREVVPPRPEPFLPGRRPDHPEPVGAPTAMVSAPRAAGDAVVGATARSLSEPAVAGDTAPEGVIERDPSVNRSLLLRLIAGVRGL